jgi:sugar/nucleoside kinase (ribokinase family)
MSEVGCAGILVEDTFCGPLATIPAEGALTVLDDMPVRAGGCAANVAIDLAKQGVSVDVAGCVGADSAGEVLLNSLKMHGVEFSNVTRVRKLGTSKTFILLVEGQDRRYLHVPGANQAFTVAHIAQEWLSTLRVFYLGGLFALPGFDLDEFLSLLQYCRLHRITTVVDVVVPQGLRGMSEIQSLLPAIDVFIPNEDEASAFTGFTEPVDQLQAFEAAGAHTVIITRGAQGSVAARAGNRWRCGSYQMGLVDPSGSGDAFASGVIRGLLSNWEMPQLLRYASAVGASVTRAAGTTDAVFSAVEAEAFVREHSLTITEEI